MRASIVDLRYKMRDVLKALDRKEQVTIVYHGKVKGVISPRISGEWGRVADHPFFGMARGRKKSVREELRALRRSRVHDL